MRKFIIFAATTLLARGAFCQIELRSFDDALKIAKANNLELALEIQKAQEGVRYAKKNITAFLPIFDFSFSDSAGAERPNGDTKIKSIEAGATQKIFNGGKTLMEWKMRREESFYQFLSAQKSEESFRNALLQAYYSALLAKLKSQLLEKTVEDSKQTLLAAQIEAEEGFLTETEWLQSLWQSQKLQMDAKKTAREFEGSERLLKRMMGISTEKELFLCECEEFEKAFKVFSSAKNLGLKTNEFIQNAAQNSVDLKIAGAELNWSKKSLSMQRRFFLPSVSVRGAVSFSGRNYPLASPSYSLKIILGFENNPWIQGKVSRQSDFSKSRMNSMSDSISGQGMINTSYFNQMKIAKTDLLQKKAEFENAKKRIEEKVWETIKKIEGAEENFFLALESAKIKERKLGLSKIQVEEGRMKKSDYIEELNECAKQKIECLAALKERDCLIKELESMSFTKIQEE